MRLILKDIAHTYPGSEERLLAPGRNEYGPGEPVALVGGNGTGKTTLLKIIAGLIKDFRGERIVPTEWRIAFIPATLHHFLLPWYTAEENLAFYSSAGRQLTPTASTPSAADWARLLNRGDINSLITRPVYALSTGERASLALLCALSRRPHLLLLDELFANASLITTERMLEELTKFSKAGGLIVFTTHQQDIARRLASHSINLESYEEVVIA